MINKTHAEAVFKLYKAPFKFQRGYIFDGSGNMVADNSVDTEAVWRTRGWGRINHDRPDAEEVQDALGKLTAQALDQLWENQASVLAQLK